MGHCRVLVAFRDEALSKGSINGSANMGGIDFLCHWWGE